MNDQERKPLSCAAVLAWAAVVLIFFGMTHGNLTDFGMNTIAVLLVLSWLMRWWSRWREERARRPKPYREQPVPRPVAAPKLPPPPPPPPPPDVATLRRRYEAKLRSLEAALMDEDELEAAKDEAKKRYLRDVDQIL